MPLTVIMGTVDPALKESVGRKTKRPPERTVDVETYQEASEACMAYVAEHGIAAADWDGGGIYVQGSEIGVVTHSGDVMPLPLSLRDKPLYSAPKKPLPGDALLAELAFEEDKVFIPKHGSVIMTAIKDASFVRSAPGEFFVDDVPCEFEAAIFCRRGDFRSLEEFIALAKTADGTRPVQVGDDIHAAVEKYARLWHDAQEPDVFVRNAHKESRREEIFIARDIAETESRLAGLKLAAVSARETTMELLEEIEKLDAPAPRI